MALEQHFQITLKALAIVLSIRKNRQITQRIEGVLNPAQDWRAERIGHIDEHYPNALAFLAAQKTGHSIGAVAEALGGFFDALPGARSNITSERRVVENDRNSGGRKASGPR